MAEIINNFYVLNILYIIVIVSISIYTIKTMKIKYSINFKDKLTIKNIDLDFLFRMIALSFVLRIIIEQTIYFLSVEATTTNNLTNIFSVLSETITTCFFAPIFEEIIFRFGLYDYLNTKIKSTTIGIFITSIIFSLLHFYGVDGFVILLVISLIWNYSYIKTNNLIYSIIMHFLHNVYAMVDYAKLNNVAYILFGCICLVIYVVLKNKSSSKNTTTI